MNDFILSIDEGTTGIQTSFFGTDDFTMYGNNKIEFTQIYPKSNSGHVEHNPQEIWQTTLKAIDVSIEKVRAIHSVHFTLNKILAIGITNQRETCLAWNKKTGELAGNALVWQDRRTTEFCNSLKENDKIRNLILQKTGLVCDPYFSASKMKWMLENYSKAKLWAASDELALGTIDSYIIWRLTDGVSFVTDHTNASRTMLLNIQTGEYDEELLKLFSLSKNYLAEIQPSVGHFGYTKNVPNLPNGIPISGVLGDQQAALFGQNCHKPGEAKITFGTGAFLLMNVGKKPNIIDNGLLSTIAFTTKDTKTYALEGSAFIAGAAVQMLRDNFGWVTNSKQSAEIAMGFLRDEQVLFVPSLSGLGAPYWNPQARGVLFGLSRGTQKAQIIRAVLESIALQNVQLLQIMEEASGQRLSYVGVDGGASSNNFLMQFQANMLQTSLLRPENIETTSLGAAKAAFLGVTNVTLEDIKTKENFIEFKPTISTEESTEILKKWLRAVECVNLFYSTGN